MGACAMSFKGRASTSKKQTLVNLLEVAPTGHVHIRFEMLGEAGDRIGWHRTAVEPGGDVDAQIAAVNADITTRETLKAAPVHAAGVLVIKKKCKATHTP